MSQRQGFQFDKHYKEIQQRVCNRETTPQGLNFLRRKRRSLEASTDRNETFDLMMWFDELTEFTLSNMTEEQQNRNTDASNMEVSSILAFSGDQLGKSVVIKVNLVETVF